MIEVEHNVPDNRALRRWLNKYTPGWKVRLQSNELNEEYEPYKIEDGKVTIRGGPTLSQTISGLEAGKEYTFQVVPAREIKTIYQFQTAAHAVLFKLTWGDKSSSPIRYLY